MILFESDWERYPDAIPDYQTTNQTFITLVAKYKKMGIKNYEFILALHQPELQGVDPHSPYLSMETMSKIALECYRNPWYFFREVVRVPPQGSPTAKPFRANRGNIALYWLFFNHIDPCLIQPRQTGKSVSTDCLMIYILLIGAINTRINMLTKDDELRRENIERMKNIRVYLPPYLQSQNKKDSDNSVEVTCRARNNRYGTMVAQKSEAAANNVGRGLTAPVAHIDEAPFVAYIDVSLPAMLTAGSAARNEAKAAGMPYGSIFTTTAGKLDTREGKYMYEMIHGGVVWSEKLFDCENEEELHRFVKDNSPGVKPLVNITLSHRQLGYTDEWLYETMKENNATGEKADRDFFNRWTSGGLSSPLETWLNIKIRESQKDVKYTDMYRIDGACYMIRWYIPEEDIEGRIALNGCILGMDTSDAVGRDSTTLLFIDPVTLEVLGCANINETLIPRLITWVGDLMEKFPRMVLIPERRSTGQTLIDSLIIRLVSRGIDPFRRIYNRVVDEPYQFQEEWRLIQSDVSRRNPAFYDKMKKHFGFATSGSGQHSRSGLYNETLLKAAKLGCDKCYDKYLIDEITSLVKKNDRIDHSVSGHDDMVIAWLLSVWFLTTSKNLSFYGIEGALSETTEARENVAAKQKKTDRYDIFVDQQQAAIKKEIEMLLESIRKTNDEVLAMRLERRVKVLDSRLKEDYSSVSSIDALLSEAKSQRMKGARERMQKRIKSNYTPTPMSMYRHAA